MAMTNRASMPNYAKQSMNGFTCSKPKVGHFLDQRRFVRSKRLFDLGLEGQQHYWLHVAIDRLNGQVIDKQIEVVNE
jgi:hypothetical protein